MGAKVHLQIFHDPSGRRSRRVRKALWGIGLPVAAAFAFLIVAVVSIERHAAPALREVGRTERLTPAPAAARRRADAGPWLPASAPAAPTARIAERVGFYMPWDAAGRAALSARAGELDFIAAGLARVHGPDHAFAYETDDHLRQVLARKGAGRLLLMVQNVDAEGRWQGRHSERLLDQPAARRRFLDRLERAALAETAAGVVLDIEDLPETAHAAYLQFLKEAHARFASRGLLLTIAAPVADPAWDLKAYGAVTDRVFLMAYDEHGLTSSPGPIASQPWFARTLPEAVEAVGRGRAIVALGNYAYDWSDEGAAEPLTVKQAWARAQAAGVLPTFDTVAGNSHFSYHRAGVRHEVWILDAVSAWNQLQVVRSTGAAGVALWRLGSEDPGFWAALETPPGAAPQLSHLPTHDDVQLVGKGEVMRLASSAEPGLRHAAPDADGLIHEARYAALPTTHVVERAGHDRRLVALTFDDGPDAKWTPQILDILKAAGAPATFFVTGASALSEPGLLRRIVAEGSELGNHSTTHADLDRLPEALIRLELNATQRLVESYTGRSMRLFRAPYLGDADPDTSDELRAARVAADMGYLSVGLNVDPLDWTATDARSIVARTVAQVESGDAGRSTQIVLLHDSGGDRSATIAALPGIIRELRARGYTLVTVSRLAGLQPQEAMRPLAGPRHAAATASRTLFSGLSGGGKLVGVLFVAAIALGIARSLFLTVLALLAARRAREPDPPAHLTPAFVSVLIPAYNEERVIEASVRRILASQGPRVEVIVIDDGSKDATSAVVSRAFGMDPRVTLLTVANGGKARALNHGLKIAKGAVVIALDADTQFEPDTILKLARWFADPEVGAVAGNARIGNVCNLVTRWQSIEYVTAQGLERRALSALGAITVVPGAVGAWRRTALDAVGGYPSDTLAEDQDLTITLQRAGWKVACDTSAVAWTEAPDTFRALFKQRYRWAFGTLQCLWKHRSALLTGAPRGLALVGLPQTWLFQIGFGLIAPCIDLALVGSFAAAGLHLVSNGAGAMQGDLAKIAAFWLAFTAVDVGCGWIAYALDGQGGRFPVLRLIAQRFGYRQLLYAVVVRSAFSALAGHGVGWGKLERSGVLTAVVPAAAPAAAQVHVLEPVAAAVVLERDLAA